MRVLLVTFPWQSHFHLLVSLGWGLQTAGHEVRVASGPELTDVITRSGLTAVPVGSDEPVFEKLERSQGELFEKLTAELDGQADLDLSFDLSENREEKLTWDRLRWGYRFIAANIKAMNDSMIEDLVEYCRWWKPDLVVWDWISYAGPVAAAAVGVPHARVPIGLNVDARMRDHYLRVRAEQPPEKREDPLGDWLAEWADKYGAPFSEELVTGQFTIDQMVGSMVLESDVPSVPLRYVPYNGPSVVPDWTRRDPSKRRVLATFGWTMEKDPSALALSGDQLQAMLDSVADLDIELVVTLPEQVQKELKRVPDNTRMVEFVPLHVIIPSCSAVIHHGGIPSFVDSLVHGVPQLVISRIMPDIGERGPRLERAGAGLWIPGDDPEELSGQRIREHLLRLLDEPAFREGAGRLRKELLAQPTPGEAVKELERLTSHFRDR
ncbi:activator-dependent family glycosyltransferase [Actinomadura soli]|uniref:Activator-dependent family glycosyltransferase n=1 Tax=Actinomadura soli TaxID=2508997 RepID=A0A5C4JGX1_9ACTN|nr:activator-dependent family glycosyltransferase [Actinomadura soli]TMR04965.1 activator-dependent family glycosyltransferase [Actinomadura soli]